LSMDESTGSKKVQDCIESPREINLSAIANDASTNMEQPASKKNLKRKRENDQLDDEGLALLFDESNEDTLIENIDEKTLEMEHKLPLMRNDSPSKVNLMY
jgi:hypothetical protein